MRPPVDLGQLALMVHFASLHEEYPDHISVMEEE